jgi:HAD superfamily hydrolase (TIGR01484 family)
MNNYRLIALDMDGTLLNENRIISDENLYWINKAREAGIAVCMATGRGRELIIPFMDQMGLNTPFVAVNGSEVWKDKQQLHRRVILDSNLVREMHKLAVANDVWFWAYGVNQVYNRDNWFSFPEEEQWLKFGYYTENQKIRMSISQEIASWGALEITNSDPNNIELNPLGIHKASGIRQMCEIIGCTMDEVVAMGDSMNDMAMILDAGLGVAMGNAQEVVKQAADIVAPTNEEDGVGFIIRQHVLGII